MLTTDTQTAALSLFIAPAAAFSELLQGSLSCLDWAQGADYPDSSHIVFEMTLISLLTLHPGPAVDLESSKELSDFKDLTRVDYLFFTPCQVSKKGFKQEERRV